MAALDGPYRASAVASFPFLLCGTSILHFMFYRAEMAALSGPKKGTSKSCGFTLISATRCVVLVRLSSCVRMQT
jgi:hypothetical protein